MGGDVYGFRASEAAESHLVRGNVREGCAPIIAHIIG